MYMYKKGTQFKMVVHTFFLGSARSLWSYFSFFNRSEEKKKIILCTSFHIIEIIYVFRYTLYILVYVHVHLCLYNVTFSLFHIHTYIYM